MPQKKNPDALELIRGKTGRLTGNLVGLMTTLKGLPSTYNKDLQEDKEALFDTLDTLAMVLPIATGVIKTLKVFSSRITASLEKGMLATDLADYLVRKGIPFRQCHHLVGQAVRRAEELEVGLAELELAEYQTIHPSFDQDLYAALDFQHSVEARYAEGGTAPSTVRQQIVQARRLLDI
jgi:argininosuccinate lyase